MSNVIDFNAAREQRRLREENSQHNVLDTHDAVLDVSDVVLTAADLTTDITDITEDTIVIQVNGIDGDDEESSDG